MSETERVNQIKLKTEQMEKKALMEEQKLRLIRPNEKGSDYNVIE